MSKGLQSTYVRHLPKQIWHSTNQWDFSSTFTSHLKYIREPVSLHKVSIGLTAKSTFYKQ